MPTSRPHDRSPFTARRRSLLLGSALAGSAALIPLPPALADDEVQDAPAADGAPAQQAGTPRTTSIALADAEPVEREGRPARAVIGHRAALVGVTWPEGSAEPAVAVRGLQVDGAWSPWHELEVAMDPETGARSAGTEPGFFGDVTQVEVIATVDGTDVTSDLTAHLIAFPQDPAQAPEQLDEGGIPAEQVDPAEVAEDGAPATGGEQSEAASDETQQDVSAAGAPAPTSVMGGAMSPVGALPQVGPMPVAALTPQSIGSPGAPRMVTRAQWGAQEGRVRRSSAASALSAVVLHHTAGTNNYTASQAAQQIRGIFEYHVGTLGWADIGYNVLIDRFGTIYEGRSGGLHRHITGAHAYGFNTGTAGISVMGNYENVSMSATVRNAIAQVAAWKLLGSFRTSATETFTQRVDISGTRFRQGQTVTLPRFYGHRDVNSTSCPGNAAYRQMGTIRGQVQAAIGRGWRVHQRAFASGGGRGRFGDVTHIAKVEGAYTVTRLTQGIIVSRGDSGVRAHRSLVSASWRAAWGSPVGDVRTDGNRTVQPFENGVAVRESNGSVRFVTKRFRDVAPQRVFFTEITDLANRGITQGWGDNTFRPNNDNWRDAMIVFIYRALGSPAYRAPARSPFRDVPTSNVFYRELCWAHDAGIARGWSDGRFEPFSPVKRDAVAAFLYRAAGEPAAQASAARRFVDVPVSHVFAKEIGWLASTGISRGWDDGTFRPNAYIKRDQMAAFIMRWMEHTGRL